jgi:subtilisin-like proprotein convertase family protein
VSASFKGKKILGEWQLLVKDNAGGDQGTLDSFGLVMTPALFSCE